jgi:hypothetical protein
LATSAPATRRNTTATNSFNFNFNGTADQKTATTTQPFNIKQDRKSPNISASADQTTAGAAAAGGAAGYAGASVQCASNANDVLIVSKRDCGNGGGRYFSGYASGGRTSSVETDMKRALYCGWRRLPGVAERFQPASGDTQVFDQNSDPSLNPYWTFDDIKNAAEGKTDPIICDLGLSFENASPDPEENYYHGCK